MIDYLLAIIIGVLASFVASLMFLLFLTRVRPKIVISPQIAKGISLTGETDYRIKIINKTRRSIINVKAQLYLVMPSTVPGGFIRNFRQIPLRTSELMELSKFNPKDTKWASYEYRFVTEENIENLWEDNARSFLHFGVYATDSVSGLSNLFTKDYHNKRNSIKKGNHKFGNSLEIE